MFVAARTLGIAGIAVLTGAASSLAPAPAAGAAESPTTPPAAASPAHDGTVIRSTPAGRPIPRPSGLSASAGPSRIATAFVTRGGADAVPAGTSVARTAVEPGARGGHVVRLQQSVDGVPVLGGETTVDLDRSGNIRAVVSESSTDKSMSTTPIDVGADAARSQAIGVTAKEHGVDTEDLTATAPTQWWYDPQILGGPGLPGARLVWRTEVTSAAFPGIRQLVLVDAHTGATALSVNQTDHALNRSVCDAANANAAIPCVTPVRSEGDPAVLLADANLAYQYSGDTYSFYKDNFGRDSLDNAGMNLLSTVRYCHPSYACPYQNAFWNGQQMVYGQGFASADDVVGHELTHGVTEFTSNLFYYYQSGSINESLSDIFGEFIDQVNGAGNDDPSVKWKLGEDLPAIGAIRDMAHPENFSDPDRTGSANWSHLAVSNGGWDNGGVHTNSGVGNKFAYLITDGDTFNGQTVTGLGIPKAAQIIYGGAGLLTSASDYQTFAAALRQSCSTLIGTHDITSSDCAEVDKALLAVQMDTTPANAPLAQAPVCIAGKSPVDTWTDDMESPGSGNWTKAQTLGGNALWYYTGQPTFYTDYDAPKYATSGTHNLWGSDPSFSSDMTMAMSQSVRVPEGDVHLRFRHAYQFEVYNAKAYDGGVLEYSTDAGSSWQNAGALISDGGYNGTLDATNPLGARTAFTSVSTGYTSTLVNLATLAGQDVRFRFRITSDSSGGGYGWYIDDVRLYACATAPAAPTLTALTPGDSTLTVASTLGSDGGSPVTDVQYRLDDGTWQSTGQTSGSFAITGLVNGTTYNVAVRAVSGAGPGPASNTLADKPVGVPGAPALTALAPGDGRLTVASTLGSDGGSPVTDVQYRLNDGTWQSTGQTSGSFAITGLVNGTTYNVAVRAVNGLGNGPESNTLAGKPRTVPGAPTGVTARAGNRSAVVSWTPPTNTGGSPITSYRVTSSPGAKTCSTVTRSCTVTGLTNGTGYRFTVRAINAAGAGAASALSNAVIPRVPATTTVASAVSNKSKILVQVLPKINKVWTFRLQVRSGGRWVTLPTVYRTGTSQSATVNRPKGTYRAVVPAAYGYLGSTSTSVILTS